MVKLSKLLKIADDLINSYNPTKVTPTTHADEFLEYQKVFFNKFLLWGENEVKKQNKQTIDFMSSTRSENEKKKFRPRKKFHIFFVFTE
jgi:hypothetical protein